MGNRISSSIGTVFFPFFETKFLAFFIMSTSGNICASIFLIISMLFILIIHLNGYIFQVPEEPIFLMLYLPLPVIFTIGSVAWLYFTYQGAMPGGYPISIDKLLEKKDYKKLIASRTDQPNSSSNLETVDGSDPTLE